MDDLGDYVSDDELAVGPLGERGWEVETVSWRRRDADWKKFAAVIIRTTWDYQDEPEEFLRVLRRIRAAGVRLANPLQTVEWNLNKIYLRDLEQNGVRIVPTVFTSETVSRDLVEGWFELFGAGELIIKPAVSATAQDTFRLTGFRPELGEIFRGGREYLVQPFMENIVAEGEYSLFYFNGRFSHAILKTPQPDDFRVQEEWGGRISSVRRPPEALIRAGQRVFRRLRPVPLYARIDFVRDAAGSFALMELELIEPSLYFRMDTGAPQRFAEALSEWMGR